MMWLSNGLLRRPFRPITLFTSTSHVMPDAPGTNGALKYSLVHRAIQRRTFLRSPGGLPCVRPMSATMGPREMHVDVAATVAAITISAGAVIPITFSTGTSTSHDIFHGSATTFVATIAAVTMGNITPNGHAFITPTVSAPHAVVVSIPPPIPTPSTTVITTALVTSAALIRAIVSIAITPPPHPITDNGADTIGTAAMSMTILQVSLPPGWLLMLPVPRLASFGGGPIVGVAGGVVDPWPTSGGAVDGGDEVAAAATT